jgi:ferredoxin
MAEYKNRFAANVPGRWYTDTNCIDCDMCRESAPTVFKRDSDIGYTVVYHQPETPAEIKEAEEAMEGCPVEAIGKDGPGDGS